MPTDTTAQPRTRQPRGGSPDPRWGPLRQAAAVAGMSLNRVAKYAADGYIRTHRPAPVAKTLYLLSDCRKLAPPDID